MQRHLRMTALFSGLPLLAAGVGAASGVESEKRPNILLIIGDDKYEERRLA